ncbi:MAG: phosphoribosylformylglycinamidine synthase subunit PurL [Spirochaetia bacterium]|nr:phosphoribosylformylglycinamidine synthase subunit PurL [Spirochaetia bacterium]
MQTVLADREGTPEEAKKLGLLDGEYDLIVEKIGRRPTFTELAMFSGMWSEHCSYKNSILLLKKLYCESDRLLAPPGEENAGALRINDKLAVVFKIESHNHPSAIEPYQGAATGVGGIMRDVFTMGARPIASLNSLRFGMPDSPRNRYLLREVVKGIGDYGNSLGIACSGGEVFFHNSYTKNPLVNAMTVGIAEIKHLASSKASGIGNRVMYVGAKTGRDGIHGASFASKDLSNESAEERSAVQVGDPFMEKLVMEATLECIEKDLVIAIQDMGAAGLLSSSSEMSSSGDVGIDLYLDKVPARETGMVPFEFLLSESQERMLMVVTDENMPKVQEVFEKWELDSAVIGEITDRKKLRVYHEGKIYADLPVHSLTVNSQGAPRYEREVKKVDAPSQSELEISDFTIAVNIKDIKTMTEIVSKTISHPNIASKHAVYEQYDTDIGNLRVIGPGQNAGVYRVPQSKEALSMTVDGNGFYISIDPYSGALHTVAESYRNIVSSGAEPLGITNCLNFANPYKPENYYFFKEAVTGMSDAAREFKLPITGGNVSFYNESEDGPVLPTPTIGMVGLLEKAEDALSANIPPNHEVYICGFFNPALTSSQYLYISKNIKTGPVPEINLQHEIKTARALLKANQSKLISSAADVSSGGILTALLKGIFYSKRMNIQCGFQFASELFSNPQFEYKDNNLDIFFFGESASSYIISVSPKNKDGFLNFMKDNQIPTLHLGDSLEKDNFILNDINLPIDSFYESWLNGLSKYF